MREPLENPHDNGPTSWSPLPVLGLLAIAWLVLAWPWLSGRVTIPWDAKAQFQPQIQFLAQSLWRGESPFWAPFVFSGQLQIADPQSMIFSPPFLALALASSNPSLWAVDSTVFLVILAGAAAIVMWFRDRGWHWAGALIAAIAFGFGASMAWRIQHTGQVLSLAYLPIVQLLLSRALERGSKSYGASAGIVAAFLVLGRDQVALLSIYFLVGYVVVFWLGFAGTPFPPRPGRIRRSIAPLTAGALAGVAIIALPILMTALAAEASNRPSIDLVGAERGSLHPALLITMFAPDLFGSSGRMEDYWGPPSFAWPDTGLFIAQNMGQLYIGAVPALLLVLGLICGIFWRRDIRFFLVALLFATLYALGWYTPFFRLAHTFLPGVDFYRRPADATFLIGYLAAILAGYQMHRFFDEPLWRPSRLQLAVSASVALAAFTAAAVLAFNLHRIGQASVPFLVSFGFVCAGGAALLLARHLEPLRPAAAAMMLVVFTIGDLAWNNGPGGATALPPGHYSVLDPSQHDPTISLLASKVVASASATRRDRVEIIGLGFHWPNASLTHRLENTLGYNPVRSALYAAAVGAGDTSGAPQDRKFTPLFPSYKSPLANLLGLRFIAAGAPIETIDKSLGDGDLTLVARTDIAWVYENRDALPRVLYATEAKSANFDALIANGGLNEDFTRTVLLEHAPMPATRERQAGRARLLQYTNTTVEIEAEGADGGWLVLNDLWHPWWRVEIDGRPQELLRANVLFRAVEVPPGRHTIVFTFHPVSGAVDSLWRKLRPEMVTSGKEP